MGEVNREIGARARQCRKERMTMVQGCFGIKIDNRVEGIQMHGRWSKRNAQEDARSKVQRLAPSMVSMSWVLRNARILLLEVYRPFTDTVIQWGG